jgi:chorismate mutase
VEIGEIRKRIDLLDDVLLRIFNERARLALEIGRRKQNEGLPVYDPSREKRIFARMKGDNPGPLDDGAIVRLFERVVDESRRLERIKSQGEGPEEALDAVKEYLIRHGFDIHQSTGANRTIIGVIGDTDALDAREIEAMPGVSQVVRIRKDD